MAVKIIILCDNVTGEPLDDKNKKTITEDLTEILEYIELNVTSFEIEEK